MVSHTYKKLDILPFLFVVVSSVGVFVPCIIALSSGHVSPYVPYISEGGGEMPEAGIFTAFVSFSSLIGLCIICLRYLVVEYLNSSSNNYMNTFLNKISFILGCFSTLAMIVAGSFSSKSIAQVHNSAAGIAFACYVMYLIFHTWISFRILGRRKLCYSRLVITICTALALVFVTTFGVIGSSQWTAKHWPGKKMPEDNGFVFYIISAIAEWVMVILLVLYFATFLSEFRKSKLHFQLEVVNQTQVKPRLRNLDINRPYI